MALDINEIRARLSDVNSKGNGSGRNVFWRPQDGNQDIRIVPTSDGDPFKDYHFHYNLGPDNRGGVLCPNRNFGEQCPICEFKDQLWKDYNRTQDSDTFQMAKDLTARQRFFTPVLVRGEEADGVRLWGFGKEAYTALLQLVLNEEYGDITDVEDGTDLTLQYGKPPGAQFPKTTLTPRRRTTPLCDDRVGGEERCNELMENIPDFDSVFQRRTPEEMEEIFNRFVSSLDGDTTVEGSDLEVESTTNVVDKAFSDLVG